MIYSVVLISDVQQSAESLQLCPTLCYPMDCSPPVSSVHGILQARTGVVCHFLLQGIFPTQGSNPRLLCWQSDSLPLSCQGSLLIYVNCSFNFYQEKRSRIYFKSDLKWQMNKHTSFIIWVI